MNRNEASEVSDFRRTLTNANGLSIKTDRQSLQRSRNLIIFYPTGDYPITDKYVVYAREG